LSGGLVMTITLVAFEALAVSTVMPDVAAEFGADGTNLYGWAFTAFFLGTLIGIVAIGGMVDRGLAGTLPRRARAVRDRPADRWPGSVDAGARLRPLHPGPRRGRDPADRLCRHRTEHAEELRPRMFAWLSTAWALPGVLGPAIAGIVGDAIGWRAVFLGLLPLVVVAAVATTPALRAVAPASAAADEEAADAASLRRRLPLALIVTLGTALFTAAITIGDPVLLVVLGLPGVAIGIYALRRLTPPGRSVPPAAFRRPC
jgi:MFS family permease